LTKGSKPLDDFKFHDNYFKKLNIKKTRLRINLNDSNEDIGRFENEIEEITKTKILEFDPEKMVNRKY
jgi:hypothetical protein